MEPGRSRSKFRPMTLHIRKSVSRCLINAILGVLRPQQLLVESVDGPARRLLQVLHGDGRADLDFTVGLFPERIGHFGPHGGGLLRPRELLNLPLQVEVALVLHERKGHAVHFVL